LKRIVKKLVLLAVSFTISTHVNSKNILEKKIRSLSKDHIIQFSKLLTKVCDSSKFLDNLENHKSFPNFGSKKNWKYKCRDLKNHTGNGNFKKFLVENFNIKKIDNKPGLLTGYYEPLVNVSNSKDNIFKFPILKENKNYFKKPRAFIEKNFNLKDVILWTDDPINLFFLQIQGSGIGEFQDKKRIRIGYAGNNDLKYTSIGKILLKKKYIKYGDINLFSIKDWLRKNPQLSKGIMNQNERYIFFRKSNEKISTQVSGALGVPLKPNFSIAVDKNIYPLGLPFIIEIYRDKSILPAVSMDTGAAIVGTNRADLFLGRGEIAEQKAGKLKKKIFLYTLIPYNE
tara:strand:+ start:146 stop:1171 length:1026 start_codon:yes stop_codon:yes gene_type:complete